MQHNPFSLDFGAEPNLFIPRNSEQNKIINTFSDERPSTHMFLLTGARGSGKTVLMTSISHIFRDEKNWMHIDLNSESDMLNSLAANIYNGTKGKFPKISFSVSIKGVGLSAEKEEKYTDIQADIDAMLKDLDKNNIRLLITVDEITNAKNVREFTSYYQHCLRENFPVFLIMTGLYKNIRALQNNRSQTFLKRAPKIDLRPLNIIRVSPKYAETFMIDDDAAYDMAKETAGYSYAFQILGYLTFEAGKKIPDKSVMLEYRASLVENSYDKIWEELSAEERRVVSAIAKAEDNVSVKEVREVLELDSNRFSTYQSYLQNEGILSETSSYGRLKFELPYFKEFAERMEL